MRLFLFSLSSYQSSWFLQTLTIALHRWIEAGRSVVINNKIWCKKPHSNKYHSNKCHFNQMNNSSSILLVYFQQPQIFFLEPQIQLLVVSLVIAQTTLRAHRLYPKKEVMEATWIFNSRIHIMVSYFFILKYLVCTKSYTWVCFLFRENVFRIRNIHKIILVSPCYSEDIKNTVLAMPQFWNMFRQYYYYVCDLSTRCYKAYQYFW